MSTDGMWELFMKTGDVLFYLLYKELSHQQEGERTA